MKLPITITQSSISVDLNGLAPKEVTTIRHAAQSFAFLLRWQPNLSLPHSISFDQFADQITRVYDAGNPQIADTVATLRSVHERQATQPH